MVFRQSYDSDTPSESRYHSQESSSSAAMSHETLLPSYTPSDPLREPFAPKDISQPASQPQPTLEGVIVEEPSPQPMSPWRGLYCSYSRDSSDTTPQRWAFESPCCTWSDDKSNPTSPRWAFQGCFCRCTQPIFDDIVVEKIAHFAAGLLAMAVGGGGILLFFFLLFKLIKAVIGE
jgi:hypothetical protein